MTRFQFLVPVDGSERSKTAAKHAVELAKKYGAEVSTMFVVDTHRFLLPDILEIIKSAGEEYVSYVRELAQNNGVTVRSAEVLSGLPVEMIVNKAKEIDANIIVIAAKGGIESGGPSIGFIANRVLRYSSSHVLLVRSTENREHYQNILISTDGSKDAKYAAHFGMSIARRYNAKVYACNIVDTKDKILQRHIITLDEAGKGKALGEPLIFSEHIINRLREHLREDAALIAEDVKKIADEKGITTEIIVKDGKAAPEILNIVKEKNIDLVVLGSHGKSSISKLLVGSLSEKIASTAKCSVLVVRGSRIERVVLE
jgi:nucleotide-binding universal stress UspA family protein